MSYIYVEIDVYFNYYISFKVKYLNATSYDIFGINKSEYRLFLNMLSTFRFD